MHGQWCLYSPGQFSTRSTGQITPTELTTFTCAAGLFVSLCSWVAGTLKCCACLFCQSATMIRQRLKQQEKPSLKDLHRCALFLNCIKRSSARIWEWHSCVFLLVTDVNGHTVSCWVFGMVDCLVFLSGFSIFKSFVLCLWTHHIQEYLSTFFC